MARYAKEKISLPLKAMQPTWGSACPSWTPRPARSMSLLSPACGRNAFNAWAKATTDIHSTALGSVDESSASTLQDACAFVAVPRSHLQPSSPVCRAPHVAPGLGRAGLPRVPATSRGPQGHQGEQRVVAAWKAYIHLPASVVYVLLKHFPRLPSSADPSALRAEAAL